MVPVPPPKPANVVVTELGRARADRDRVVRADGLFFQRLAGKPGANPVIVPRVLMIHQ